MKRITTFLIIALLLVGCTASISQSERAALENYESYYQIALNEQDTFSESEYYTIEASINPLDDGTFRYDVFIDQPTIAMRDVVVVIVENDTPFENQAEMMPSIGIFDDPIKLYPNQVDAELSFYKGINLNRIITQNKVTLKVLIEFTNANRDISYHEVIEIDLNN